MRLLQHSFTIGQRSRKCGALAIAAVGITLSFGAMAARAADARLTVGFAEADITPKLSEGPVFLAGFGQNRQATRIQDPIMARAVVLGDGKTRLALVSVDLIGLFYPVVERIRQKLPEYQMIVISATHNHEGPDTLGLWGKSPIHSGVEPRYLAQVEAGIVFAIRQAERNRLPAQAEIGTATAPELLTDNRLPLLKHDELVAIRFRDPETGRITGLVVQWNCHPETLGSKNTAVSADFVSATVNSLHQRYRCPVVYFTGTVGGLLTSLEVEIRDDSGKLLGDGTVEKTERYGVEVGRLAERALRTAKAIRLTPFVARSETVLVPVDNGLYRLAWQAGILKRPIYRWSGDPRPAAVQETADIRQPVAILTEVGYLRLGELEVALIPGEIYPELVLGRVQTPADPGADFPDAAAEPGIYPQLRGQQRMVIGLANDEIGYLIPKRQWDEKPPYCYGRKRPQYGEINSVGPEAAGIIAASFCRLVAGEAVGR